MKLLEGSHEKMGEMMFLTIRWEWDCLVSDKDTLLLFNIAMENGP